MINLNPMDHLNSAVKDIQNDVKKVKKLSDDETKCIGLSVCGGPCDEACPVIRKQKDRLQG